LKAYVLIQTVANGGSIAESVRAIPGVLAAEDLSGPFDAIALAQSDSTGSLTEQIVDRVRRLPGVIRALSAPVVGSLGQGRTIDMMGSRVA
jgi:DNA-binding Lrp family transcriptional regulator